MSVRYTRAGVAAVLTIDRPERRNAVDGPTAEALLEGFRAFEADDDARALVLTGAGGQAFCAGFDLKAMHVERTTAPEGPMGFTRLTATKPTIAAIDGWCVAGGLELALWCDVRLCSPRSTFGCLERRWGVPLIDGGTQRLPQVVGLGRALDLILTGRQCDADEALRIGLVTAVQDDPLAAALAYAETLAGFPQDTMLADRRSVYEGLGRPLEEGLRREADNARATGETAVSGAAKFAAKLPPPTPHGG